MGSKYLGYGSSRLADRPSELRINVFQRLGNIMLGLFLGQMAYRCSFINISMCDHPSTRLNEALDCVVTLGNSRNQGPEALAHAACKGFYCKLVSSLLTTEVLQVRDMAPSRFLVHAPVFGEFVQSSRVRPGPSLLQVSAK